MANPVFVNPGIRSGWLHGTASQERIEAGDLVVVDVAPKYMGYCANLTRTFVIGGRHTQAERDAEHLPAGPGGRGRRTPPRGRNREIDAAAQEVFT